MTDEQLIEEEFDAETQNLIVSAVKKSFACMPLNSSEVAILFFWQRHRSDPNMQFVKERLNLTDEYETKKKKRFWRKRTK